MSSDSPSNVLLITVDSLRADAISPYDDSRHTPVMDDLAERGTVYEQAFATGNWTPFSFPGIMASQPVFRETGRIGVEGLSPLASVLSEAGIETAGFNAANGFLTDHWGYDEGFDSFESFVASVGSNAYSRYLATHPTVEAWVQLATAPIRRLHSWVRGKSEDRPFLDASRMFDVEEAAVEEIESNDGPSFVWVHYMDTHTPYVPAPRYIREVSGSRIGTHRMLHAHTRTGLGWEVGPKTLEDLRMLYQAAVRQVDASIGRLLEAVESNGQAGETAVVLAGDHGEEFQEHGHLAHYPKLYDELIHVPLIVDVPGRQPSRVDSAVGLDAIPPTVTDLLDVDPAADWSGRSLVPSLETGTVDHPEPVVSVTVRGESVTSQPIPRSLEDGDLWVSVRDRDWTYIECVPKDTRELYYRPTDPTQQTDLSEDPGEEGAAVMDRFAGIVAAHGDALGDSPADDETEPAANEDLEQRLTALGYR
ncbi:MAG: sulfatase-like hydrolase/transferase [Halobacteriota archaeon]